MSASVDGPQPASVPDGTIASTQTQFVPDASAASAASATQDVLEARAPTDAACATQYVPDGVAPDGACATQYVPDASAGPALAAASGTRLAALPPLAGLPRFGRFQAVAELGAGATGSVYRAHDDVLGRAVAIKVLHGQGELAVRERFLHEARAVGAVAHPHIVSIYDVGTDAALPYLVMELAPGGSLRDQLAWGPLAVDVVRTIGIQIARALAAAHAARILHRDVKPANILRCRTADATLGDGDVWKLADFGIARLPDSTLTVDGQFLGSPAYAAPEALRAGLFSPASDVYALGATLYEALAGAPPHGADDVRVIVRKLDEDVRPLRAHVPRALADTILATLARDPAHRPSADALAEMLAASTLAAPALPATRRWPRVAAIVAVLVAIGVWSVFLTRERATPATATPAKLVEPVEPVPPPASADTALAAPSPPAPSATDELAAAEPAAPDVPSEPASPEAPEASEPTEPAFPTPDYAEAPDPWPSAPPEVFDERGVPVDDEAARALLERMERDARGAYERSWRKRGRGRWRRVD